MNKISKKLNKVIVVEGTKGELLKVIEKIKDENISLISVSFPKNLERLSTSYVNSNWRTSKNNLDGTIFFAKCENNKYMFACGNGNDASKVLSIVKESFLSAEYNYLEEVNQKATIVKKIYKNGLYTNKESSAEFTANKFSVARIFA